MREQQRQQGLPNQEKQKKKEEVHRRIVIIGAGAAGLAAGIAAARQGAEAVILEHMEEAAKKLLLTGNGRCNYTNTAVSPEKYYGDPTLIRKVLKRYGSEEIIAFFREIGIEPRVRHYAYDDSGYVYPASGEAADVRAALLSEFKRLGGTLVTGCRVEAVICDENRSGAASAAAGGQPETASVPAAQKISFETTSAKTDLCTAYRNRQTNAKAIYRVQTDCGAYDADAVIFACGSNAYPKTGSDSSIYPVLKALGQPFHPYQPALCMLKSRDAEKLRALKGCRAEARAGLHVYADNDMMYYESFGEVQFTENGISGIPVMQLARFAPIYLKRRQTVELSLNLLPQYDSAALRALLMRRILRAVFGRDTAEAVFRGLLPHKAGLCVLREALGIDVCGGKKTPEALLSEPLSELLLKRYRKTGPETDATPESAKQGTACEAPAAKGLRTAAAELMQEAGMRNAEISETLYAASACLAEKLAGAAQKLTFSVSGTAGFDAAQCCNGGVDASAIDADRMESRIHPELYFAGEMLDADGLCGGYNLHFAFATGLIAGSCAAGGAE